MSFWARLKNFPTGRLVGGLLLITLLLRLPLLTGSFWLDEAAQILESSRPWSQQFHIQDDFQPPLLHVLTFITRHISVQEAWLRLWGAVIPSLLVTWGILQLLSEWWPKTSSAYKSKALWLGLLLATNSLWVFYSQELRPYSLAVMWTVLSWWAIVRLTKNSDSQANQFTWIGWAVSVLGGLYSTYLFPFVLISQGLYLGWQAWQQPRLWKGLIGASLLVGAGFAPWIPSFLGQLQAGQQLRSDLPGWDQVVSTDQLKSVPLAMGKFLFGVVDLQLNLSYLGIGAIVIGTFMVLSWQIWHQYKVKKLESATKTLISAIVVMFWWIVVPIVLAWLVSFKIPVIQPKRILFVLPALYCVGVIIATEVKSRWLKFSLGHLALLSLLLINVWSLSEYYRQPVYQRENWREIHNQLVPLYPPDKTLAVFAFPAPFAGWQWYDQDTYPSLSLGYLTEPTTDSFIMGAEAIDVTNKLKTANETYQYILVFEYLEPLADPARTVKASLYGLGWREMGSVNQPGVGFVRIYAKPNSLLGLIQT